MNDKIGVLQGDFKPDSLILNYDEIHLVRDMIKANGFEKIIITEDTEILVDNLVEDTEALIDEKGSNQQDNSDDYETVLNYTKDVFYQKYDEVGGRDAMHLSISQLDLPHDPVPENVKTSLNTLDDIQGMQIVVEFTAWAIRQVQELKWRYTNNK